MSHRRMARSEKELIGLIVGFVVLVASLVALARSPLAHPGRPTAVSPAGTPPPPYVAQVAARIPVRNLQRAEWSPDGSRLLLEETTVRIVDRAGHQTWQAAASHGGWLDDRDVLTWEAAADGAIRGLTVRPLDGRPAVPIAGAYREPVLTVGLGVAALEEAVPVPGSGEAAFVLLRRTVIDWQTSQSMPGKVLGWSPDGHYLALARDVAGTWSDSSGDLELLGYPGLHRMRVAAELPVRVAAPLVWDASGEGLAYTGQSAAGPRVVVWRFQPSVSQTPLVGEAAISWGREGLYYRTSAGGSPSVRLWRFDGSLANPNPLGPGRAAVRARSGLELVTGADTAAPETSAPEASAPEASAPEATPAAAAGPVELRAGGAVLTSVAAVSGPAVLAPTGDAAAIAPWTRGDLQVLIVPQLAVGPLQPAPVASEAVVPEVSLPGTAGIRLQRDVALLAVHGPRALVVATGTAPGLYLLDLATKEARPLAQTLPAGAALDDSRAVWLDFGVDDSWTMTVFDFASLETRILARGTAADSPLSPWRPAAFRGFERRTVSLALAGGGVVYPALTSPGGRATPSIATRSLDTGRLVRSIAVARQPTVVTASNADVAWIEPDEARSDAAGTLQLLRGGTAKPVVRSLAADQAALASGVLSWRQRDGPFTALLQIRVASAAPTLLFTTQDGLEPGQAPLLADSGYVLTDLPGLGDGDVWLRRDDDGAAVFLEDPANAAPDAATDAPAAFALGGGWIAWLDATRREVRGVPLTTLGLR